MSNLQKLIKEAILKEMGNYESTILEGEIDNVIQAMITSGRVDEQGVVGALEALMVKYENMPPSYEEEGDLDLYENKEK
jgi:hypothetical protein